MGRFVPLLVGAIFLAVTSCGGEQPGSSPAVSRAQEQTPSTGDSETIDWDTYSSEERGVEVTYPSDWYRAEERLTPKLQDPLEILSLGTYPLRPGGDRCDQHPVNALEDLGPDDAFILVLERAEPYPASGYPPRPSRFELPSDSETNRFCVPYTRRLDEWLAFSDGGRAFYLLVALGDSASEETRMDLFRILNSLNFNELP